MSVEPTAPELPGDVSRELAAAVRARKNREFTDDLLDGPNPTVSTDDLAQRATTLGHDVHSPHRVLALAWAGGPATANFIDTLEASARPLGVVCWSTRRDNTVISLAQRLQGDAWADIGIWTALHDAMSQTLPHTINSIGVGGFAPTLPEIPRSYRQAQQALTFQTVKTDPHGVTNHDQLGIRGLITKEASDDFIREWLAPFLDYDTEHQSELTKTLSTFLRNGRNYSRTAITLRIHRATLLDRLHLIRSLTPCDLADPEIQFNLQLATRILLS